MVNQDTAARAAERDVDRGRPEQPEPGRRRGQRLRRRTWTCTISGTPCSALGDAYSGTYFSNDGGCTWCCARQRPEPPRDADPGRQQLDRRPVRRGRRPGGRLRQPGPRVLCRARLQPDRGARTPSPSTRARSTAAAHLSLVRADVHQPDDLAVDAERQGMDRGRHNAASPFRDRVYVTWTRFKFNAHNGSIRPVADLLRLVERRRRDVHLTQVDRRQRALQPGLAPGRGPGRDALRVLGRLDPARDAGQTYVVKSTDGGATCSKPVGRSRSSTRPSRSRTRASG